MSMRRDRDERAERDNQNDSGSNFFGMALAGIGIGAAIYGASKLFGSGNSNQSDNQYDNNKERSYQANSSRPPSTNQHKQIRPYSIEVIETEDECIRAITRIESYVEDYPVVGLDCEWANDWYGNSGKVAVLSLCAANGYCVLLRLSEWNHIPSKLKNFLINQEIIKVGVGIDLDKNKLQADYNLLLRGMVDLRFIAKRYDYETRKLGYLANQIVGISLNKDCDHSSWDDDTLPDDYIEYAAMDVFACTKIITKLVPSKYQVVNECAPFLDKTFTTNMNNF